MLLVDKYLEAVVESLPDLLPSLYNFFVKLVENLLKELSFLIVV